MAGFFAQYNAYLDSLGTICAGQTKLCSPFGDPHTLLYDEARNVRAQHNPFYDIKAGCNSNDVTIAQNLTFYCAGLNYDQVTGWGSANMLQLAWAFNWEYLSGHFKRSAICHLERLAGQRSGTTPTKS
jgi:hypothetical protein